ncbi:hypothetical protein V7S43_008409 [Phytophthora oleae]|uniref:BZIP domain-containing protein n=1 Tax=Phytophthora oleae TaxID=2107226 RepID=A0ABD3FMJ6_9STRA
MTRKRPRQGSTHDVQGNGIDSSALGSADDTNTKRTRVVRDDDDLLSFLDTAFALETAGTRDVDFAGDAGSSGWHRDDIHDQKDINIVTIATTALSMVKQGLALTPPAPSLNQTRTAGPTVTYNEEILPSGFRDNDPWGRDDGGIQDARGDEQQRRRNRDYMRAYRQKVKACASSPAEGGVLLSAHDIETAEADDDELKPVLRPVCGSQRAEAPKRLQYESGPSGMDECVCVSCDSLVPRCQSIRKTASDWKYMGQMQRRVGFSKKLSLLY